MGRHNRWGTQAIPHHPSILVACVLLVLAFQPIAVDGASRSLFSRVLLSHRNAEEAGKTLNCTVTAEGRCDFLNISFLIFFL